MEQLATSTGGTSFVPGQLDDLDAVFRQIAAELRSQYLLQYYSKSEASSGTFLPIGVQVPKRLDLRVRARQASMSSANKTMRSCRALAGAGHRLGSMRVFTWAALVILLPLAGPLAVQGQTVEDVIRVDTSLVQLNVGVADRQGKAITDLRRDDFTVYEDGVRQSVLSFASTTTPFSLALLLDMSGSTLSFRQNLKLAAWRFIDALAPDDRVAVITFSERTKLLTKFTADRGKIAWAIDRAEGRGGTELYAALDYALQQLASEGKRRKAIIVLTDGLDTSMRNLDRAASINAQTDEEAVAAIKPEASRALSAVLYAADRQGVTIYPLALPSGDLIRLPIGSPQLTAIYTAARARLNALAERTGGHVSEIRQLQDLARTYAGVAADLRTLYTISYQPSGGRPRDGRWRAIRVDIYRPELIARTRPGYYAQ